MSNPVGRSNSKAGPPPGVLQTRSVTAAISRSGLTVSLIRARSLRFSRSARKSLRSEYIGWDNLHRCINTKHTKDTNGNQPVGPCVRRVYEAFILSVIA